LKIFVALYYFSEPVVCLVEYDFDECFFTQGPRKKILLAIGPQSKQRQR
jgi:hypothetical protein